MSWIFIIMFILAMLMLALLLIPINIKIVILEEDEQGHYIGVNFLNDNVFLYRYYLNDKSAYVDIFGQRVYVNSNNGNNESDYLNSLTVDNNSTVFVDTDKTSGEVIVNKIGDKFSDIKNHNQRSQISTENKYSSHFENKEQGEDKKTRGKSATISEKFKDVKKIIRFILHQTKSTKKLWCWVIAVIKRMFNVLQWKHGEIHIRGGVSDPHITGVVFGFYMVLVSLLPFNKQFFFFEPCFNNKDTISINGECLIQTSLGRIISLCILSFLQFPYINIFLVWRRYKVFSSRK